MAETIRTARVLALSPEFDDFLFASIGEERNGMLLSVVSALARLDVDPWQEAANLAQLPGVTATRRLASLIAALPDALSTHLDPSTNAARLIAHLPRRVSLNVPAVEALRSVNIPPAMRSQNVRYIVFVLMVLLLGGVGIAAGHRSAPKADIPDAPASSTVIPPTPPSTSGQ